MSDEDIVIEEPVALATSRCYQCGRWWAYERFARQTPSCPVCSQRTNERLQSEVSHLTRSVNALRGAARRAKKARR